ncbi:glycosyltransferase [Microbacterium sp. A94]|uniref:glycosyltransferase n=1 Tax=Microbacterium sp. A94 TaxID=3450717 RepID=UPI003F43E6F9
MVSAIALITAGIAVISAIVSAWQVFAISVVLLILVGITGLFIATKFISFGVTRVWQIATRSMRSGAVEKSVRRGKEDGVSARVAPERETRQATLDTVVASEDNRTREGLLSAKGYWAKQVRNDLNYRNWIVTYGQSVRSLEARDVLALAATNYAYSYSDLCRVIEISRTAKRAVEATDALAKILWKPGLLALARLLYGQNFEPFDRFNSFALYRLAESVFGLGGLTNGVDRSYYSDLICDYGDIAHARRVLDVPEGNAARKLNQSFLRLNTHNPKLSSNDGGFDQWLEQLNEKYAERNLAPIRLRPGLEAPYFRITADADNFPRIVDGPLVSIVMPVYEPDEATDLAIESLLAQTWVNIELIAVDDASPTVDEDGDATGYRARLERWERRDPRVRVVFCDENRGAYAVRNDGYDLAKGEFVTIADKDDWHHPQKIQIQVEDLMADPSKHANMTNWVRVDENLRFQLRWGPDRVIHPSFASLMYRTDEIRRTLGYWDTVRKSGDGEFKFRFQQVYGVNLQPDFPLPLAFSLLGEGNLTSADLGLGYEDGRRRSYRESWLHWHKAIADGTASPYLPKSPAERPFPAPNSFLPDRPAYGHFDVIFLSEFGFEAGNTTALQNDIRACVDAGLRVAILPLKNGLIESAAKRSIAPEIAALVHSSTITRLALTDEATARLMIVRWPAIMEAIPAEVSGIRPEQTVVIANHMPYELGEERYSYDVQTVTSNVATLFGIYPTWVAESRKIRPYLVPLVPSQHLSEMVWPGVVSDVVSDDPKVRDFASLPVVGRHARDAAGKWPDTRQDFRRAYMNDAVGSVSILGGAKTPLKSGFLTTDELSKFDVHAFKSLAPSDYLRNLDFFIYFHSKGLVEAFGMAIVEAMAAGVVCILQPDFEPVFGDAAVYVEPGQVEATVRRLWDSDAYRAQQERGLAFVSEQCSASALIRRLGTFGVVSNNDAMTEAI